MLMADPRAPGIALKLRQLALFLLYISIHSPFSGMRSVC